jgi:hypothetical protein
VLDLTELAQPPRERHVQKMPLIIFGFFALIVPLKGAVGHSYVPHLSLSIAESANLRFLAAYGDTAVVIRLVADPNPATVRPLPTACAYQA